MNEYLSYPEGYEKLCHDLLPLPLRPFKKMLMPLCDPFHQGGDRKPR